MDLKKFGFLNTLVFVVWVVIGWLSPISANNVDWLGWMSGPVLFWTVASFAYFGAMVHQGGFAVVWPYGHSATATGGVAKKIPARGNYPEMAATPIGGGNVAGVILLGGKKYGWLVCPTDQIYDLNGQLYCITNTRTVMPRELPAHVLAELKDDRLFDSSGPIEFGLLPWNPSHRVPKGETEIERIEAELNRLNATNNELQEAYITALDTINLQSKQLQRMTLRQSEQLEPERTTVDKMRGVLRGREE